MTMIVGVDGSAGSTAALTWAAARTGRFGPIRPVVAWQYPWWAMAPLSSGASGMPPPEIDFVTIAREKVDEVLAGVQPVETGEPILVKGPPGEALVEAGKEGSLLVVGTRGHGPLAAGVLGSVSLYCVNHATVPVVVVPVETAGMPDDNGRVVVGFDGSPHAVAALRWAVANTGPDVTIDVFHCRKEGETADVVRELLGRAVADAAADHPDAESRIRGSDHDGDPRHLLREASVDADLLVLGARGHEGVAHLLLGSVTTGLIHHPIIPTVVVR